MADQPKLIIDSDWKSQAQAEKERLEQQAAAKVAAKKAPMGMPGAGAAAGMGDAGEDAEAGPMGFRDIVAMLATQAMSYMGYFPDPRTGQAVVALDYAKLHIDMLGILEEKTKGNLTEEEQAFMTRSTSELRLAFVELSKAVAKAVQEGRIKPQGGPGGGVMPASGLSAAPGASGLHLGGTT
jgi:hypothetical protein